MKAFMTALTISALLGFTAGCEDPSGAPTTTSPTPSATDDPATDDPTTPPIEEDVEEDEGDARIDVQVGEGGVDVEVDRDRNPGE